MKVGNTASRLQQILNSRNLRQIDIVNMCKPYCEKYGIKLNRNDLSQYISGRSDPGQRKLTVLSEALKVNPVWLMGYDDVPMELNPPNDKNNLSKYAPTITDDTTTFPVIGEVAAGFDHITIEDWAGDTIEIPNKYLAGRKKEDFFVIKIIGDSMFPTYQEDDKVLILKQSDISYSGEIAVVVYDENENSTLKKIERNPNKEEIKLIPINPSISPITIKGEQLEYFRILGVPKLLIREIE